jgi:hypothetical protein
VAHVYREENPNGEEVVRIIPAREADPRERRIYLEHALAERQKVALNGAARRQKRLSDRLFRYFGAHR